MMYYTLLKRHYVEDVFGRHHVRRALVRFKYTEIQKYSHQLRLRPTEGKKRNEKRIFVDQAQDYKYTFFLFKSKTTNVHFSI